MSEETTLADEAVTRYVMDVTVGRYGEAELKPRAICNLEEAEQAAERVRFFMEQRKDVWKRVGVGDEVLIALYHCHDHTRVVRKGIVTEIVQRFGTGASDIFVLRPTDNLGGDATAPEGVDRMAFAGAFITKVLKKKRGPEYRYRANPDADGGYFTDKYNGRGFVPNRDLQTGVKKSQWVGNFHSILTEALKSQKLKVPFPVHSSLAAEHWLKTRAGFVGIPARWPRRFTFEPLTTGNLPLVYIIVNKKPFMNWLQQNLNRFLCTRKELDVAQDQYDDDNEREYYDNLQAMEQVDSDITSVSDDEEGIVLDFSDEMNTPVLDDPEEGIENEPVPEPAEEPARTVSGAMSLGELMQINFANRFVAEGVNEDGLEFAERTLSQLADMDLNPKGIELREKLKQAIDKFKAG